MISKRIQVFGKVHGVLFRVSTKEIALQYGLKGWVRNELDGSVLIEVSGDSDSIEKLVEWSHTGSAAAIVERVEVTSIPFRKFEDFSITS